MRVIVVGAGVFGAWTALWLRRAGAEVTLVDAYGPGNSLASSGGETRLTRSAHGVDDHYPRWQRRSLEHWLELERSAGLRLFVPSGVLWFAHGDGGFETDSLATLERLGIPVERWPASELVRRYPQVATDDLTWALFEPEGGALLARRGVAIACEAFAAEGGEVRIGLVDAPSEGDGAGGELHRLRLADGTELAADAFVFACGPWLPKLFGDLVELAVTRQEVVFIAPEAGDARFDADNLPTWVDYDRSFYGVGSVEGRGFKLAPDWPGPLVDPDRQERRLTDPFVEASREFLRLRFPALAERPVAEGRVCQYESTADAHFIADRHPAWENAWIVGGGSGHGFKHGPAMGEHLCALVLGGSFDLAPTDDRFRLGVREPGGGLRTAAFRRGDG
ncbi:MAG: FAD-dependent oxidoreductase [Chloroflexota bacterium]